MILIDTSAWIDFFKGKSPLALAVEEALEENQAAICGPILTELRQGFRAPADRKNVLDLLSGCRELSQPDLFWEEAGDCGFALRRKGKTIKSMDLLIASYAMAHRVPILTADKDFHLIQKAGFPLEVIEVE